MRQQSHNDTALEVDSPLLLTFSASTGHDSTEYQDREWGYASDRWPPMASSSEEPREAPGIAREMLMHQLPHGAFPPVVPWEPLDPTERGQQNAKVWDLGVRLPGYVVDPAGMLPGPPLGAQQRTYRHGDQQIPQAAYQYGGHAWPSVPM